MEVAAHYRSLDPQLGSAFGNRKSIAVGEPQVRDDQGIGVMPI